MNAASTNDESVANATDAKPFVLYRRWTETFAPRGVGGPHTGWFRGGRYATFEEAADIGKAWLAATLLKGCHANKPAYKVVKVRLATPTGGEGMKKIYRFAQRQLDVARLRDLGFIPRAVAGSTRHWYANGLRVYPHRSLAGQWHLSGLAHPWPTTQGTLDEVLAAIVAYRMTHPPKV